MLSSFLFTAIYFVALASAGKRGRRGNRGKQANDKPHLLTFVFDDLGWRDLGAYGAEYSTPFLDQMISEESVSLTNYYTYSSCAPSRAALSTGRYTHKIGMQLFGRDFCNLDKIPYDVPTIGESLKEVGYETAWFGKWHLGQASLDNLPPSRGFDYYFGLNGGCLDYYDHTCFGFYDLWENEGVDQSPEYEGVFLNDILTDKMLNWLDTVDGETPIHMNVNFYTPHGPIQMPPKSYNECDHISHDLRRTYCHMLNHLSANLERVVDVLKEKGIWDDALVVFTSDNGGSSVGAFDDTNYNYYSVGAGWNHPHRAGKATLMEGGIHNRAWITGGLVPEQYRGTSNDELLQEIDITFGQRTAAGLKKFEGEGVDLFGVAFAGASGHEAIFLDLLPLDNPLVYSRSGVRKGKWKYIDGQRSFPPYDGWYYTAEGPPSHEGMCDCDNGCLFDLDEDPEERTNLLTVRPDIVSELQNIMAEARKPENGYLEPQLIKTDEYWAYCSGKAAQLGYWSPALPRNKECWMKSDDGVDLAPGEWEGTGGTDFEQCMENAKIAGTDYFAWTGEVYQPGYCKVLKKMNKSPNLKTNQGYGYQLYENTCRQECWKESEDGVDLAPGEWDGTGGTDFVQCKNAAKKAGVNYFAWTGDVYQPGYCKVLKKSVEEPNFDTNQGYGYKLFQNRCASNGHAKVKKAMATVLTQEYEIVGTPGNFMMILAAVGVASILYNAATGAQKFLYGNDFQKVQEEEC